MKKRRKAQSGKVPVNADQKRTYRETSDGLTGVGKLGEATQSRKSRKVTKLVSTHQGSQINP